MKRWGMIGALAAIVLGGIFAPSLFASGSTTPMACYSDSGSTGIRYRFYDSGAWSSEYTGDNIYNGTPWVVTRWCPTREEYTCATIDWSQRVHVRIWQNGSWLSPMLVDNSCGTTTTRPIDAAYEQVSGDGLVAYWSAGSPARLHYRTFNGTTLSSAQTLDLPGTQRVTWARLYPKAGTDLILLLALNEGRDLYAAFWTGSGWSNVTTLDTNTNSSDSECFDAAYEGLSGDLLVTYTSSGSAKPKYRTFNGSSWSNSDYLPSVGAPQRWLRMTADPVSDQILFACADSYKDLNVCTWSGSSWGSVSEFSGETMWDSMRAFDISYANGGTQALVVYSRDWLTSPRYRVWNGSSWSSEHTGPSFGDYMTLPTLMPGMSSGQVVWATQDNGSDFNYVVWDASTGSFSSNYVLEYNLCNWSTQPCMLALPGETGLSLLFTDVSSGSGLNVPSANDADYGSGWHWGDFDNDGDLDAICTGSSYARLLLSNNASGSFTASTFGGGVVVRQGAILDIDNDGDLDFFGLPNYYAENVWVNNGSGVFSNAGNLGLTMPTNTEGVAAADIDHDGRCDVVVFSANDNWIGFNTSGTPATLSNTNSLDYGLNDPTDFGNGDYCSSGDVNNDGHLDFFYHYGGGKLFLSDGDGTYTQENAGIAVKTGEADKMGSAWGDFDNDGDLDLWVSRQANGYPGYLWMNSLADTGTISFTNVATAAGITDTSGQRGCCWGDYDNDGDLDLYIVTTAGIANVLYQNQGAPNWNFVPVVVGAEAEGDGHDAVFVDYDNDGDLDLSVTQEDASNTLLRNNTDNNDYLKVRVIGGGSCGTNAAAVGVRVELWDQNETTLLATREIGTARGYGGTEPMWVHFGGVNPTQTYTVKARFVGGWASEQIVPAAVSTTIGSVAIPQMLTIEEQELQTLYTDVSDTLGFNVRTSTDMSYPSGLHWDDFDGDGDMDAIVGGNSYAKLVINNGPDTAFTLSNFGGGCVYRQGAVFDVDNDGDYDYRGLPHYNTEVLWVNNGSAGFTSVDSAGFGEPYNNEGMAACDVNGDGVTDIIHFAENGNWIGHNQSTSPPTFAGTKDASYGMNDSGDSGNGDYCSSGDVNNDGLLDFFYHYNGGKLFLSNGDGTYTQNNEGITVVTGDSDKMGSAWADYDNDGDLDLFVSRHDSGQLGTLWRNDVNWFNGAGSFTDVTLAAGITNMSGQSGCCWGDYDNDGDLDLYVVTYDGSDNVLYRNQGDGTFVESCAGATAPGKGQDAAFVDYDNDGDLDLTITQEDTANTFLRNNTDDANYLKVRVIGKGAGGTNKVGTGIRVELWDANDTALLGRRDLGIARGLGGTESHWAHFGGVRNNDSYKVKVYFTGRPVSEPYSVSVVPSNATTTIGGRLIPHMLTVTEPDDVKVIRWREVKNRPAIQMISKDGTPTGTATK